MVPKVAQFPFIPSGESRELADDIREIFADLERTLQYEQRAFSGECHPTLDVLETDETVDVIVDVSGIPREALRVVFRAGMLVVAGEKAPAVAGQGPAAAGQSHTFHLVEREFGRFARVVRLNGAFDINRARATVQNGELTIVLPKLVDRRGQAHRVLIG
jgi:HSP20 family protein